MWRKSLELDEITEEDIKFEVNGIFYFDNYYCGDGIMKCKFHCISVENFSIACSSCLSSPFKTLL